MHQPQAIRVRSLRKAYRSGGTDITVFDDLSFDVRSGERLALMGESGAGKSTLLHLVGGLDAPTGGTIHYGQRALTGLAHNDLADFRNRQLGFVWQNPSLLPEFTASENVMMPLLIRGVPPDKSALLAAACLDEVGLRHRPRHRAGELSGGEQQRVAIARAIVGTPAVLLADEPTGSLDFRTGESIIELLTDLHRKHGFTSVFVTHNLSFAKRCDRVLELKKGTLHPLLEEREFPGVAGDATRLDGGTYV